MTTYSPSQLRTFLQCPRRWALQSRDRARFTRPAYLDAGDALDARVRAYLDTPLTLAADARAEAQFVAMRPLLPHPGTCKAQAELSADVGEGITLRGFADAISPPSVERMVCLDSKTTASKEWALNEITIHDDVQAQSYAYLLWRMFNPERVFLRWVYVTKDARPKAWSVDVEADRDRIFTWAETVAIPAMRAMRTCTAPANEVEHDPETCGYGSNCWVSYHCKVLQGPIKGEATVSLIKRIAVNPPPPAETAPPAVATVEVIDTTGEAVGDTIPAPPPVPEEAAPAPRKRRASSVELTTEELVGMLRGRGYEVTLRSV